MELKDIENVGDSTLKKLKEKNYNTLKDLEGVTFSELINIGLSEKTANSIISAISNKTKKDDDVFSEFNLKKQNKYLVAGFKISEHYNENLKGKELEKAFEKFKGE